MGNGNDLNQVGLFPVDHHVWETAEQVSPSVMQVLWPCMRRIANLFDGAVKLSYEFLSRHSAPLGIPSSRSLRLENCVWMEVN